MKKLGIKNIFIIVLAGALILSLVFRPSNKIDTYEDEIKLLHDDNKQLLIDFDSVKLENVKLSEEIKEILITIDSNEIKLRDTEDKLKDLEDEKDNVSDGVRNLNADGIANSLSDYLNGK